MNNAKISIEKMNIPTYPVGKEEKNPMFFEKRVYQGSSGKVYPNPVIEKIYDEKEDKTYTAIILENDYLYVIVLPELGGRIYTAYDKSNNYDFVYHNKVIKPALVGLLGPWISGGIEFNWPQHHRPSTYMPVNYEISTNDDGSVSAFVGEIENMFGLKGMTEIKLYKDKAFIEINAQIYNRSDLTETFLWWANPAYRVNDYTRTIMPPDVSAVMDHGKRAVSTFPIASGEYYKMDYSAGVDISRYKNIQVPTSFMAHKSNFDFVGGYDDQKEAGIYHFADHHISPGKKQWTWGCGDFGLAWDRNLTDNDGAYVELMTGCFTDNQPDFTFIRAQEEKNFTQYFMPYRMVGEIKNANRDFCFGVENNVLTVYSTGVFDNVRIQALSGGKIVVDKVINIAPNNIFRQNLAVDASEIHLTYDNGKLDFASEMVEKFPIPSPATAIPAPTECLNNEDLYLFGLHIEQYRHATRLAEDYYLEGLKRDKDDSRINTAYGLLLLRRGQFALSKDYFTTAINKLTAKNPNPITTEAFYYLGVAEMFLEEYDSAYDHFYKCLWGNENKTQAYYYLAVIEFIRGKFTRALEFADRSIQFNNHNTKACNIKGEILLALNKVALAKECFEEVGKIDKLDVLSRYGIEGISGAVKSSVVGITPLEAVNLSYDYIVAKNYAKAKAFLQDYLLQNESRHPLVLFYLAYVRDRLGEDCAAEIKLAVENADIICFPNRLSDIVILGRIAEISDNYLAYYYLGNLFYDKKQYKTASEYWELSERENSNFATAKRNLALYYYNKKNDAKTAVHYLEKAFALDTHDDRIFYELFKLYQIMGKDDAFLYRFLCSDLDNVNERDDLYLEYVTLVNSLESSVDAERMLLSRKFHPWEGGEGKVTALYKNIKIKLAYALAGNGDYNGAIIKLTEALSYPHNLGEGKLILDYSNDIYYHLGVIYEQIGDKAAAEENYLLATKGDAVVANDMYYNDTPIDYIYYMALAYDKLGDINQSSTIKLSFENYYYNNIDKQVTIDYFAVSLPEMLIWEQDINEKNKSFCNYILGLSKKI